jgi:hypothetical protein
LVLRPTAAGYLPFAVSDERSVPCVRLVGA